MRADAVIAVQGSKNIYDTYEKVPFISLADICDTDSINILLKILEA